MTDWLDQFVLLLEYLLLIVALRITLVSSIARVISTYQVQCLLLALAVAITAWGKLAHSEQGGVAQVVELIFILVLPLVLMVSVGWLLRRATAHGLQDLSKRETGLASPVAETVWRDATEQAVNHRVWDVAMFVTVVILAALIAQRFDFQNIDETIGLTVSLTLHLIGLYMITAKRDLISQTVGLLVMDHGLYLAVVKIVALPAPGLFFVIGLWFYTAITLFILVYLVPQIRGVVSEGIDLDGIAKDSDLKG